MDYTNFVRTYYRSVMSKLNGFNHYSGSKALLDEDLGIPNEYLHATEANLDALPNFEVNINAPIQYFERFLDYYGKINLDLNALLMDKEGIIELYNSIIVAKEDEVIVRAISLYVSVTCDSLVKVGVLQ